MTTFQRRFARFAWGVLVLNLLVILGGAFVRATGSGAGCGSAWPLCNGQVIPRAEYTETLIEFSHRLTSGLALVLVLGLFVWARRAFEAGHRVRLGASLSLFFIVLEALIGAGLVLLELVAFNPSVERAAWVAVHLANTFLLVGALTLTAWWASGGQRLQVRGQGVLGWLVGIGCVSLLVVGASGAITALGDTLFPAESLRQGLQDDFSPTAHFLIRLRIWHPVLAVITGVYTVAAGSAIQRLRPSMLTKRLFWALAVLFGIQLGIGLLNVALLAPVWMQLVHLLLADLVWIAFVLLGAAALAQPVLQREPVERAEGWQVGMSER